VICYKKCEWKRNNYYIIL